LTGPVAALNLREGLNGTAKRSLNSQVANASGLPSASRTAPLASGGLNSAETRNANAMASALARRSRSGTGPNNVVTLNANAIASALAQPSRSGAGPNNVVTRNASATPTVPARPSASVMAVIRNALRTGGGQNNPIGATGRAKTAAEVRIA